MATYKRISAKQWENWLRMNFVVVNEDALVYMAMNMENVAFLDYRIALSCIVDVLTEGVGSDDPDWVLDAKRIIAIA